MHDNLSYMTILEQAQGYIFDYINNHKRLNVSCLIYTPNTGIVSCVYDDDITQEEFFTHSISFANRFEVDCFIIVHKSKLININNEKEIPSYPINDDIDEYTDCVLCIAYVRQSKFEFKGMEMWVSEIDDDYNMSCWEEYGIDSLKKIERR